MDLSIKITSKEKRMCAYTDKDTGYMELTCSTDVRDLVNDGYYRGDTRFFRGIGFAKSDCSKAKSMLVTPTHCVLQKDDKSIAVCLLIDKGALMIKTKEAFSLKGIYANLKKVPIPKDENVAHMFKKAEEGKAISEPNWTSKQFNEGQRQGFLITSDNGVSVASFGSFEYEVVAGDSIIEGEESAESLAILQKDLVISPKDNLNNEDGDAVYYITFDKEGKAKEGEGEAAKTLLAEGAFKEHCKKVDEFLKKSSVDFEGEEECNKSVLWARFHAWMLCTSVKDANGKVYWGLWAGLPWFRENWGRDTFISFTGALLVNGSFSEARSVLLGFANFQDCDAKSKTYGRIPNRYRGGEDVIFNTVDGTLYFIRALFEYIQYTGDWAILDERLDGSTMREVVTRAIDADITRVDERGFLCHEEADTWMDARVKGGKALSPRGNRACEIQALWWTALVIGSRMNTDRSLEYKQRAQQVKQSFKQYFCRKDYDMVADHLLAGGYGEWAPDLRVRPNQLFAITSPSVVDKAAGKFVDDVDRDVIIKNVQRELVTPFGLYTLSKEDPLFHAHHKTSAMYHKDAAYHNGTIWPWNSGAYISATKNKWGTLPKSALDILYNEAKLITNGVETGNSCAGSLAENIHALLNEDGKPILSGTFSQCWSLAEYLRNIYQDVLGFVPHMEDGYVVLDPCVQKDVKAAIPFVHNSTLHLTIKVHNKSGKEEEGSEDWEGYECNVLWEGNKDYEHGEVRLVFNGGEDAKPLKMGQSVDIRINSIKRSVDDAKDVEKVEGQLPDFLGSEKKKDYLMDLILGGRMQSMCCAGENTAALEWWFDSKEFNEKYYTEEPLGAFYKKEGTDFALWAPTAKLVKLVLHRKDYEEVLPMQKGQKGVYKCFVQGDLHNVGYEYEVLVHGVWQRSIDPYATACNENARWAVVVDKKRTEPDGWDEVAAPKVNCPNDAVIYEVHVADVTSSKTWHGKMDNAKRFLGLIEEGVKFEDMPTGFDYIKSLGITHVQLLPIFDFSTVDDTADRFSQYNWGYDPRNYGCLKGVYSSNPYDATVRIREFKEVVKAFAKAGIGVIMDVVYNHMKSGLQTALGKCVPGYYFRVEGYSGAGEDTASEHTMFSRYMVDMTRFWLTEYKLCGFRFDLMGLHDTQTMNKICNTLKEVKSDVLVYGEGWDMYRAGKMEGASMCNVQKMPFVAHFNDAVRCAIKGPCNDDRAVGFVHTGKYQQNIKAGIVGFVKHPGVDYSKVDLTSNKGPWTSYTYNTMNYTEIHDNLTMNDKFRLVEEGKTEEYYEQLAKMAISLVLTMQGVSVLHAGQEALRTKQIPPQLLDKQNTFCSDVACAADGMTRYVRNSYNVPDGVNHIDWQRIYNKRGLVEFVKLMITLRKEHKAFKIVNQSDVERCIKFIDNESCHLSKEVIAWAIDGAAMKDEWHTVLIVANPKNEVVGYTLPERSVFTDGQEGMWYVATNGQMFCPPKCKVQGDKGQQFVMLASKTVSIFYTL